MKRLFLPLLLVPVLVHAQIQYTLTPEPANSDVRVTITSNSPNNTIGYYLPAWVPGFYVILHHEKKISDVTAVDAEGKPLGVEPQSDPREWIVDTPRHGQVTFSYRVKGDDPGLGFFAVNVRPSTAFVLGGAAFMYVEGRKEEPATLAISNPEGWETATSMKSTPDGAFHARDYDEFIDHPIDLGKFVRRQFVANGVPFDVVFVTTGDLYPDEQADYEANRISKLVLPAMNMFGKAPFTHYMFHMHLMVGNFGGGLEHQASVTIATPPRQPHLDIDDLVTHEFFHAWNVKNIRPAVLGPFDYTKEDRTDNLWFAEGVTDYYAKLNAYRSGLNSSEDYLFPAFSNEIRTYQAGKTRLTKTLADASRGAWEGGSEGTGDLSYYNKGQLAGWILDANIRKATGGQKSLDDVLRYMYSQYHLPDKPGYPENGILLAINHVSGRDLSDLYKKLIYTTDDLPYDQLEAIGIRVISPNTDFLSLGFATDDSGVVNDLNDDVASQGLQDGDKVIAINGMAVGPLVHGLNRDGYTLTIQRASGPATLNLKPIVVQSDHYFAEPDPFASADASAQLQGWLQRSSGIK